MSDRRITDTLHSVLLDRFHKENPETRLTDQEISAMWFLIYKKVQHEGKENTEKYVRDLKLPLF